jgi:hypothetical protein
MSIDPARGAPLRHGGDPDRDRAGSPRPEYRNYVPTRPNGNGRSAESSVAFWTLVVGTPTAFSVLRLWAEAGGELQTTLLLVSNVGPLNLVAALFATVTKPVTIALVAIFVVGGMLRATAESAPDGSLLKEHPPISARIEAVAPGWFIMGTFFLAVLTWEIYSLPLLAPAAVAASQVRPWRMHHSRLVAVVVSVGALALYWWLVGPAVLDAWLGGEQMIAGLLALPPLVAFGIAGPLPGWFARGFAIAAQAAILWLVVQVGLQAISTPILPVVVTEVKTADGSVPVRGHVISVDDLHTVILLEQGGVQYVNNGAVESMVLCATPQEIPAFATRVRDYHVEDSLLSALGRHLRPQVEIDPICRVSHLPPPRPLRPVATVPAQPAVTVSSTSTTASTSPVPTTR